MKILSIIFIFSVCMSVFGQGITCDIPYHPEIKPLKTIDVIPGRGIIIANDQTKRNEAIYWNLPVSANNQFNFFAADMNFKNCFFPTEKGEYSFLTPKDKSYKNYPNNIDYWDFESKPIGNNLIKVNGTEYKLSDCLPIYVIQSKSNFYKTLGKTYDEIITKTSNWQPLSEYLTKEVFQNNYLSPFKEINFYLSGTIKFTDSIEVQSSFTNSASEDINRKITNDIKKWSGIYRPYSKDEKLPIYCEKGYIISLTKESYSEGKSFYDLNEKILTNGNKFKGIFESEIKIPRKAVCNIENSKISISIDSETKNEEKVYLKSIFIPRSINLYPTLAFTGMSHYLILKQSHRKKFIPALTIGSAGVFALAWGTKQLFYNRYLEQPNTRTNSYITANTSYHIMKVAILTYAVGVSLDLYKTCQSIKKLTRLVNEVNPKI
jgi:hypothetical protein